MLIRPGATIDALSAILDSAQLDAALFSRARLAAPWGVHTRGADSAIFHVILKGQGWLRPEGLQPVAFQAGDILFLPHGHSHILSDGPAREATNIRALPTEQSQDGLTCVVSNGGGEPTELVCGTLRFGEAGMRFVAPQLPSMLKVCGGPVAWLDATIRLLAQELAMQEAGSDLLARRLTEILVVQALRVWIETTPDLVGWPGALSDPGLSRALAAIHHQPDHSWSATELARTAGMSRSAFYTRFGQVVGEAPSAYLTRWRMVLARTELLRNTRVAEVAGRVGYGSEAAFSRAFKRHVGISPSLWRQASGPGST
jgi:AraC-like DNA-binding protein